MMNFQELKIKLDDDQKLVLAIYDLYSGEKEINYLQYTAACVLFFFLTKEKLLSYSTIAPLLYDYKDQRKYIWEDKKFMKDINILRDHKLLMRARAKSTTSRDINAHQCTLKGKAFINFLRSDDQVFDSHYSKALELLHGTDQKPKQVILEDSSPVLADLNSKGKISNETIISGFIQDIQESSDIENDHMMNIEYSPFFLTTIE